MVRTVVVLVLLLTASQSSLAACSSTERIDFFPLDQSVDAGTPEDAADGDVADDAASTSDAVVTPVADAGDPELPDGAASSSDAGPVLRYDFSGTGTIVKDLVGARDAVVRGGAQLDGSGVLKLNMGPGPADDFVDLPDGLISGLADMTILVWYEWMGTCWERVFDFGSQMPGPDGRLRAQTSLFYSPQRCNDATAMTMLELFGGQAPIPSWAPMPRRAAQLAVSFEQRTRYIRIYQDGLRANVHEVVSPPNFTLSYIRDTNCWLGRSQWEQDGYAHIRFDEFRLYDRVLSSEEIAQMARMGPNKM